MLGFLPSMLLTISPSIFNSFSISFILSRYCAAARACAWPSCWQNLLVFLQCLLYHSILALVLEFCWKTEFSGRHSLSSHLGQGTTQWLSVQEVFVREGRGGGSKGCQIISWGRLFISSCKCIWDWFDSDRKYTERRAGGGALYLQRHQVGPHQHAQHILRAGFYFHTLPSTITLPLTPNKRSKLNDSHVMWI